MTTHHPFDHGALDFLSSLAGQKTIKAECGKRVPFATARAGRRITCPECRASLSARITDTCGQLRSLPVWVAPGVRTDALRAAMERAVSEWQTALSL